MFGHLQVYSCYSFQNSTIIIDDLCRLASNKNIQALALTDKNNMFGIVEFYNACKKYNIKPILGLEASVLVDKESFSFLLLAKNDNGYKALVEICTIINLCDDQAIELQQIEKYKNDLFLIDGIENSKIRTLVEKDEFDSLDNYIELSKSSFGSNYKIAIQEHELMFQKTNNDKLIGIAKKHNIDICFSNEVRHLFLEEAETIDLLQASKNQTTLDLFFEPLTKQRYLKSEDEISLLFDNEVLNNTKNIIDECNANIVFGEMHLPKYQVPGDVDSSLYLKKMCNLGLEKRLSNNVSDIYKNRLLHELNVINEMGFADYFLIVFDYVRFAKKNQIAVGPGRGSAAGSLVAYVLGITNVDPIEHNLLFERFLNIERVSMPDIDIDFQDDRRDEVIDYVINKYGSEYVSQIVTFTTYGSSNAIKDLGKVVSIALPKLEMLCKALVTNDRNKSSMQDSYQKSYQFKSMIDGDEGLKRIFNSVTIVEKLLKNISRHPAGVVLSRDSLQSILPLTKAPNGGVVTQYSQNHIESIGLLKMDFLVIKNLSVLQQVCKDIELQTNKPFDINKIPYDDKKTFDTLTKGNTYGVFQLESIGMTNLIQKMKCDSLDDIVATIALHRPGPMENIPLYLDRKNGTQTIKYPIKEIEPILSSSQGVMIYQEQIMQVAQLVAGFTLAKADVLRVAISKKNENMMKSLKEDFIQGGISNGYPKDKVQEVFDLIYKFADYGFNKAHSVAYGYIAYQQAYLKTNYPQSFFSALLSNEQGSEISKEKCIQESKKYGIKILPPSINYSTDKFTRQGNDIRFSLLSIKHVGVVGFREIDLERKTNGLFKDIFDFVSRMDQNKVNKTMIESLIDAGAFDEFGYSRATLKLNYEKINNHRELMSLGIEEQPILDEKVDNELVKIELEKNALGIYLSKHPIQIIKDSYSGAYLTINELTQYSNKQVVCIGIVSRIKEITDKKGQDMCFVNLYDETGQVDGVIFGSVYSDLKQKLRQGKIFVVYGEVKMKDKVSIVITNIEEIG